LKGEKGLVIECTKTKRKKLIIFLLPSWHECIFVLIESEGVLVISLLILWRRCEIALRQE